jgi:hypothetical protein
MYRWVRESFGSWKLKPTPEPKSIPAQCAPGKS